MGGGEGSETKLTASELNQDHNTKFWKQRLF